MNFVSDTQRLSAKNQQSKDGKAPGSKKRVAIIGAGISGLSSAFHLHKDYDVVVFEKNTRLGGHTDTHKIDIEGEQINVDSGFIIFCPDYYPHFNSMLNALGVESQPTDMSFSAFNRENGIVYNATNPNKLFCDRKNLFRPRFLRMLIDIVRFYQTSKGVLRDGTSESLSIADYLKEKRYGAGFRDDHLLPMISALWSATPQRVSEFPIVHLVDFFLRHGLMKIVGRPQWLVVKGGSSTYVEALEKSLECDWRLGVSISAVTRHTQGVSIRLDDTGHKQTEEFDAVIFACHADTALALLDDPSSAEQSILGAIPFEKNHVVVHTDDRVMHENKLAWASWNTEVPNSYKPNSLQCCTANYWMNSLQSLSINRNVFTSLNSHADIDKNKILVERHYTHPIFNAASVAAQKRRGEINGKQNTFYTGAYWGWGFHEDGARSAAQACELLKQQLMPAERSLSNATA